MQINNFEKFIAAVSSGKCASGMVITFSDPAVSELAGDAGFDFTWIDMEHSPLTITDVSNHIMALRGTDCAPFVRVAGNDPALIKPVIDLAPAGIIIPMIKSAGELENAVSACRYPPEGTRGCGLRRAVNYGTKSTGEYFRESEKEPLIIAQIEHIDAVRNLDEILKVKHLGSICVGPYDLSGSMNKFAQPDDPEVGKVIDEICAKAHRAGVMAGAFVSDIGEWKHRNLNWAAVTTDYGALFRNSQDMISKLNNPKEALK
ncbi:MAG: 2,4-dihydroxyhept-2-ene-1,7-dioic acid aldolase [Lentisphaerae bacterium]|nr:2,4-dihydroxyhept-2-ene-1,7-dioic acid aldolase [Lentisphaerota bacterium]